MFFEGTNKSNENFTSHLFEAIPDAMLVIEAKGKIVMANKQAEKVFGYSKQEIVGQAVEMLMPERFHKNHKKHRKEYSEKPHFRPMGHHSDLYGLHKKGQEIPVEISLGYQYFKGEFFILCIIRDITGKKQLNNVLIQSEKRFRAIAENTIVGVTVSTIDGTFLYANDAFAKIYEDETKELLGTKDFLTFFKNQDDKKNIISVLKKNGRLAEHEIQIITTKGNPRTLLLSASMSQDEITWITVDITARKKAQQKLKKYSKQLEVTNNELDAFTYSVSHDLRAPLRSIGGFSQLLLKKPENILTEKGKDYLNRISAASNQMGRLIDDLLSLSRITRHKIKPVKVDLSELVQKIHRQMQEANGSRTANLVAQENVTCEADRNLIHIALENLLGNAWKFTKNIPDAEIEFGCIRQEGEKIFFVSDNGAGFDMEYADKLFGAFQRLHGTHEYEGTGIGLSIVSRIIHRHGGKVWAEGKINQGATFYFTLK